MIPEFDKNAAFIWACYGLGAVMIGVTLIIVIARARLARARLTDMEAQTRDEAQ